MNEEVKKEIKGNKRPEFNIKNGVLEGYHGEGGKVMIPDGVTSIACYAFSNCYNVTSVVIPNTVTSIKLWAFKGCSDLREVFIPNSVTSISANAFLKCTNLIIYCEVESRPEDWSWDWNLCDYDEYEYYHDYQHPSRGFETKRENLRYCPVKWGYKLKK